MNPRRLVLGTAGLALLAVAAALNMLVFKEIV